MCRKIIWFATAVLVLATALAASAATIPQNTLYVSLFGTNQDVFIDPSDGHVLYTIPIGQRPHDAVLSPDETRLYSVQMKQMADNRMLVTDVATGKVVARIPVGHMAMHLEFGPADKFLYVAAGVHIVLVNTDSHKVIESFPADMAVAVSVNSRVALVSDFKGHRITVINTTTHKLEPPIKLDGRPLHSALSPDSRYLYVATLGNNWFSHYLLHDNGVTIIDLDKRQTVGFIKLGSDADDVAVSKSGRVFATDTKDNLVAAIDLRTRKIVWKSHVPHARSIAVDPADGTVYVASQGTHNLYAIDPGHGTIRTTIAVPGEPQRIRFTALPIQLP